MKRKKPAGPRFPVPPLNAEVDFVIGTVGRIIDNKPIPPGGTHLKYVRGKGLVVVKPSTKKKIAKTR